MAKFGYAVSYVGGGILGVIWRGYVLTVLWAWFIVPTFKLPTLATAPAIGLAAIVSYMQPTCATPERNEKTSAEKLSGYLARMFGTPLAALGFGWIVHKFMPAL